VCGSRAVRPCFFQTTTVEQPQQARAALGLSFRCDPEGRAVAGGQLQRWLSAGWRVVDVCGMAGRRSIGEEERSDSSTTLTPGW
jgi:hypothetical protein